MNGYIYPCESSLRQRAYAQIQGENGRLARRISKIKERPARFRHKHKKKPSLHHFARQKEIERINRENSRLHASLSKIKIGSRPSVRPKRSTSSVRTIVPRRITAPPRPQKRQEEMVRSANEGKEKRKAKSSTCVLSILIPMVCLLNLSILTK